ncbi:MULTISPECIES: helix-turn-helix transcriptional regulator [Catenuloplanes]|uniref:DNA-binding CsgD family transcriptional regulator n=1 Tax=Catenuloplanes niger TaxID=587534 RepID=A0AAE3ZMP7_9ACTN|nr:AAA family ATPase [Catenuloplanes niger]MDR7320685.1 DNA-binding CsgD family transcriptional regulator [Catenuloplanes niger]
MASALVGRAAEISALMEALSRAIGGEGGSLLLVGDPGVGKSALLAEAHEQAVRHGARVVGCAGVPSGRGRAYGGLRQLLHPLRPEIGALRPAARQVLLAALGDGADGAGTTPQRVGLILLQLLTDATQQDPILLSADDVQWLDDATCQVLAFVVRRLTDDPVLFVAAARSTDLAGNPLTESQFQVLPVAPLDDRDAADLLDAQAPDLPELVRAHVLTAAAGNPLALTELPLVVRDERDLLVTEELPLTERLARTFGDRAAGLPAATRTLLLVIAINDDDSVAEALTAAGEITGTPVTLDDLAPAELAGLVRSGDGRIGFRHPLMRTAVERSATPERRRAVHAVLARVADDEERVLWHRASSVAGTDEPVAASLERLAERTARRGVGVAAARALERAAELSPDPNEAVRRRVAAIHAYGFFDSGSLVDFVTEYADSPAVDPISRCLLRLVRDSLSEDSWSGAAGLIDAAEVILEHGADYPDEAINLIELRGTHAWWSDLDDSQRRLVLRAAESLPLAPGDIRRAIITARIAPWERGRAMLARLAEQTPGAQSVQRDLSLAETALSIGDAPTSAEFLRVVVERLRAAGLFVHLPWALVFEAWAGVLLARHPTAIAAAGEAARMAEETSAPRWQLTAMLASAMVTARHGGVDEARAVADRAEAALVRAGATPLMAMVQLVRGTAGLAAGEPEIACDALLRTFDPDGGAHNRNSRDWGLTDLMDAAALTGRLDEVRAVHAEMSALGARTGSPLLLASATASAPLLATDDAAEAAFEAALASGLHDWPWQRGSVLLHYGSWLRRQRRRAEARGPLRAAYELYRSLGAIPWAERAAEELRATGENVAGLVRPATHALTSHELQIAHLAAQGLTNREIGERLFVSPRTVRNHLYNIFPKLGVSSRAELAEVVYATAGNG